MATKNSRKDYQNLLFIRISDMKSVYNISRATTYRWIENGKLPEPTRLSSKTVGWTKSVLDAIFLK